MSAADFTPFEVDLAVLAAAEGACSNPVAGDVATDLGLSDWGKGADFRQYQRERAAPVAVVAAVAAPQPSGLPWAADLSRLEAMPCPSWFSPDQWEELTFECVTVSKRWGQAALDAGWSALDLFGCHPQPWVRDGSRDGLVACLVGMRSPLVIASIAPGVAELKDRHGNTLRYRLRERPNQVYIWQAYAFENGP